MDIAASEPWIQRPWSGAKKRRTVSIVLPYHIWAKSWRSSGVGCAGITSMMSRGGTEPRADEMGCEPADGAEQTPQARRDVGSVIVEQVTRHAFETVVHHERG